jgi:hypothetical protein
VRRSVELYNKYRNQVHFVVAELGVKRSPEQQQLVKQYYQGSMPHVLVLGANGSRSTTQPAKSPPRISRLSSRALFIR